MLSNKIFKKISRIFESWSNIENSVINRRNIVSKPFSKISFDSNIGDFTYIGYRCVITRSEIGRYCSIGDNVTIGPGEHILYDISTSGYFGHSNYDDMTSKPCVIGNDVWIGVDSIILRGVTIGNGAVIGANSVVTKNVPAYSVVAGSPAKIIKYRFDKEAQNKIENSQWWLKSPEDAQLIIEKLRIKVYDNK